MLSLLGVRASTLHCHATTPSLRLKIEVVGTGGSHCGLGAHPAVLYAIADRLAQPEGGWRPFDRTGLRALVYPDPYRAARG